MSKPANGKGSNHGIGFRRLTPAVTQVKSIPVEKSSAIAISETRLHLSVIKYRVRQGVSSFPETEETELYRLVFREIDETLQRSEEELLRGDLKGFRQYIALAQSFITDAEMKIDALLAKSRSRS
jgi:hypothetical protein